MAQGKYSRIDGKKSSSCYCSTVTVVAFVALCLVGIWMMTSSSSSSSVVPLKDLDNSSQENKDEGKTRVSESIENNNSNDDRNSKQFEDNTGDLPENETNGDKNVISGEEENNSVPSSKINEEGNSEEKDGSSKDTTKTGIENGVAKNEDEVYQPEDKASGERENGDNSDSKEDSNEMKDGDNQEAQKPESEKKEDNQASNELLPSGAQSELLNETSTQNSEWATQAAESKHEKEASSSSENKKKSEFNWKVCNVTAGQDYIPCLDNLQAVRRLRSTKHYEHRERHCPEDPPTCLVALPFGYQRPIEWPTSREKIWYHNVPHTELAKVKGHQNWVKVSGEYLIFPGGGTQFIHGALHYIDFIQQIVPDIDWGKHSRVVLDVGCGVASFGGFLFDRDVLTMSFAPKDEHEAQAQFALERGIPAISAVMGTKRLPFPGRVFDVIHCARCRVPWHIEGGKLLLELNRVLRPGGFFVWSATPVYEKLPEDVEIWEAMKHLTKTMCWEVVSISKDAVNKVGVAVYRKPVTNECYEARSQNEPPICNESDDPNAAWNVPLQACMHKVPVVATERGSRWPMQWPSRMEKPPYWLLSSEVGVYGKNAPDDFTADYEHWNRVVARSYLNGLGINWSAVRNVMDMRSIYGGFAAALKDMKVWVMNVVSVDSPDTLPIIYERGLFGIYHDWCESFSSYPRSYDLLHADHLFSKTKIKCNFLAVVAEVDRLLRPGGKLIVRDKVETINELEVLLRSMQWDVRLTYSKDKEGLLCAEKTMWRPKESEMLAYAID